jgi:hypothetical protein
MHEHVLVRAYPRKMQGEAGKGCTLDYESFMMVL